MKRSMLTVVLFFSFLNVYGEPLEISILRASMNPDNLKMVAGVVIQTVEESDVWYDLGEVILISNPNYKMPEMEDEADIIFLMDNVAIKSGYVFIRERETGAVFYLKMEDISSVHPIIPDSSMFKKFMKQLNLE